MSFPSVSCISGRSLWTERPGARRGDCVHLLVIVLLAMVAGAAAFGITIWYYLNSWLTLPLL